MSEQPTLMHPEALWGFADVAAYFNKGETWARKIICQEGFPRPVKVLGPTSHPQWIAGEIWAWVRQRRAA